MSSNTNIQGSGTVAAKSTLHSVAEGIIVLPRRTLCAEEAIASLPPYVTGVTPPWADEVVAPKSVSRTTSAFFRVADIAFSIVLLVLLTPFVLLMAIFAGVESREPVFFGSARLGKDLRPFRYYEMRTPRFGARLVNRFGLQRVPSLINVLSGDMSLVGPTPEPPESFSTHELWQCVKWHAKPGVTGYAQARRTEGMESAEVVYWDVRYVLERSPGIYFRILAQDVRSSFASAARG